MSAHPVMSSNIEPYWWVLQYDLIMSAHELTSIENTYCQAQVHVSREVDQYVIFSFKHVYETIE